MTIEISLSAQDMARVAELRAQAVADERARQESWERSDTDGFLSQWASGITAAERRMAADLIEAGGTHGFGVLVDATTGAIVPSRIIDTRYGPKWAVFATAADADSRSGRVVEWVGLGDRALARKGYRRAVQTRRARVTLAGGSATSLRPIYVPDDGHLFNADAPVVNDDGTEVAR